VALVERHGFFASPLDAGVNLGANLLQERVRLRYSNLGGGGITVGGQYRWEANRPDVTFQVDWPHPLGLGANLRVSAFRGRQLYDLDQPLLRRAQGLDLRLRRVLGSGTVAQLAVRARHRSFSRPDADAPAGDVVGLGLGIERRLLETSRQRVDASAELFHAGRILGSDAPFSRFTVGASWRLLLAPPEATLFERSLLAARVLWGHGGDGMPVDEMFAPGGSPEMELPLRAHPQTRDGALGATPLGRTLALANLEWRRLLRRSRDLPHAPAGRHALAPRRGRWPAPGCRADDRPPRLRPRPLRREERRLPRAQPGLLSHEPGQ
jgi:hypothetical protein